MECRLLLVDGVGGEVESDDEIVSGRTVALVSLLVVLATAVVPPLGAFLVNRGRIQTAEETAFALSKSFARGLLERPSGLDVLCGSGRVPRALLPGTRAWAEGSRGGWTNAAPGRAAPSPDPWGNCYLVNIAAATWSDSIVWVLSAGPNGIVDTPFFSRQEAPGGDDVRARIR
jgi:type II secretory pathway pseudopilin PulG